MVMTYIPSDATWHKKQGYIRIRGGNFDDFKILGHFLFKGDGTTRMVMTYIPSNGTWDKKQKYIWFRGGNFNGFQHTWAIPVSRGTGPLRMVMSYISIRCYLTQETRIYQYMVSGWGSHTSCLRGDGTIMYGHDLHTIRCYLTQGPRICMV
jgi:hypothetical protein